MVNRSVSIVTGVINESENIVRWLDSISFQASAISNFSIDEVIIVDDGSTDGTQNLIEEYSQRNPPFKIILIKRSEKNGLLDSNITGARAASSKYIVVMDADLQHDARSIPFLLEKLGKGYEIAIGSRYMDGGTISWEPFRDIVSRTARTMSHMLFPSIQSITDPLSGFFACRRELVASLNAQKHMTKTLLFLVVRTGAGNVVEAPIHMNRRTAGSTKVLDSIPKAVFKFTRELLYCHKNRGRKGSVRSGNDAVHNPQP